MGETSDDSGDVGGPPLTREQQRALRKSQARGAGKDLQSEGGKASGRGRGKGRGRGRAKKVVEDLDEGSGMEDLPEQPTKKPARRTRAKAAPKSKAKAAPKSKTNRTPKSKDSPSCKPAAKKSPRAKAAATPDAELKRKRGEAKKSETMEPKCAKGGKKPGACVNPVPMEERKELKKFFSLIVPNFSFVI